MMKRRLEAAIRRAVDRLRAEGVQLDDNGQVEVTRPPLEDFGDFSTNAALVMAKAAGTSPRAFADRLIAALELPEDVERTEVAGPGFINFHLGPQWLQEAVREVLQEGDRFGNSDLGQGRKVQVEFVSANPTGPVHVGHGRGAVIGDVLASLLSAIGYDVRREFYVNDSGSQMLKLGESVAARYLQAFGIEAEVPEDGYHGEYVTELAREIVSEWGDRFRAVEPSERVRRFTDIGLQKMLEQQKQTLKSFGAEFDVWFSEKTLHDSGKIEAALRRLRAGGYTYEKDGALWLRSTAFGDDKDRVLLRSNNLTTYLAADVAYHIDKFERGFDRLIDIWGPDHHGYITRTKAAMQALGYAAHRLDILVYQIVRLFSGGQLVRVSKRAGELITLDEVVEEVGRDAARFFFLMRSADSHLDFDLDLAKKQSAENPVYYVQYAHARVCSILRKAIEGGLSTERPHDAPLDLLNHPEELSLMRMLAELPEEIEYAAVNYEPHRMTKYAQDLAAALHSFYTECQVLSDDKQLTAARLALTKASQIVLNKVLTLMGVAAPERM